MAGWLDGWMVGGALLCCFCSVFVAVQAADERPKVGKTALRVVGTTGGGMVRCGLVSSCHLMHACCDSSGNGTC